MSVTPAKPVLSARQRWALIAQGMQHDLQAYSVLHDLLGQQFHAALRHDAGQMAELAARIEAQAQALEQARHQRFEHAQALMPAGSKVSMTALFAQLQPPLREQLLGLWQQLESLVQTCKERNLRNCQLIMEQAEVMRTVIASRSRTPLDTDIYAPR